MKLLYNFFCQRFLWLLRSDISLYTCAASGNRHRTPKTARGILIALHVDAIAKRFGWNWPIHSTISISCIRKCCWRLSNSRRRYQFPIIGNYTKKPHPNEITANPSPISRVLHLRFAFFSPTQMNGFDAYSARKWCVWSNSTRFTLVTCAAVFLCGFRQIRLFSAVACLLRG